MTSTHTPRSRRSGESGRHRQHLRGSVKWGRIQIVILFVVQEGLDAMLYFGTNNPVLQREMLGFALIRSLWSTVCLVAIWQRQNWARYLLCVDLFWSVIANGFKELALTQGTAHLDRLIWPACITGGHLLVGVLLMASPQIRKLTNPERYSTYH